MATVHFGRLVGPAGFSRAVAIKRLHAQFARDPEFVAMFIDEARLAGRIFHPNVVPTLDVVATDSELFLVMEYVRGAPLSRLIRAAKANGARIPPPIVASVIAGMLHGLHAAHEARDEQGERLEIVHRDVSPQNVMVDTDGVARVLDFGVAKAAGRQQTTRDGQLKGKLGYMAPEQLRGARVTRQTDVYAAAVVLWEALTAQRLFKADSDANVLAQVLEGRVPRPSGLAADVTPALDRVVLRGTVADPSKRYATAREMAQDLEAAIACAPPSAVGRWVEEHAADELRERAARVAEIERSSGSLPELAALPAEAPTMAEAPAARRGSRRVAMTLGALSALGACVALAALAIDRPVPPASAKAATRVIAPPAPEAPTSAPLLSSASVAIAPALPATIAPVPSPAPRPRAPAKAASKPSCDPPSTTDERGHVHFKPECF
jgi:serine/threonine-protein kinase